MKKQTRPRVVALFEILGIVLKFRFQIATLPAHDGFAA